MINLHHHYEQLTSWERSFADEAMRAIFRLAKESKGMGFVTPRLAGDDSAERAVDALARWIIESRE